MSRITIGSTCWKVSGDVPLGSSFGGGTLICKSGGVAWIVAPSSTAVCRSWFCRNDAVTTAQSISGCTGWFIPTVSQLQNPGYACRNFWTPTYIFHPQGSTWSNAEASPVYACAVRLNPSFGDVLTGFTKSNQIDVRAFRCVTY